MARVKGGTVTRKRRKKVLKLAKGYYGSKHTLFKTAKEIADKLMRARQKVAELKGATNTSIFTQYLSILTVGLSSMSLFDLMNLTMFQLYDLVERYMLYVNWDLDAKTRLAGGKPDSKPDDWMKNIH